MCFHQYSHKKIKSYSGTRVCAVYLGLEYHGFNIKQNDNNILHNEPT